MDISSFIHDLTWGDLPQRIQQQARRCLVDTVGVAICGSQTDLAAIIREYVQEVYAGRGSRLWLDGREVSAPGAALAHGMTIDALDLHDGHPLAKGHAGAAVVPGGFAAIETHGPATIDGRELLTALVVGYEVALRASTVLHSTASDYHSSGAWNAIGCAAACARILGLNREQTEHALGIAEYHGPRSQMMRCIDHPTMLKDGSGWGAMCGVSAALLARKGFTGAPAVTVCAAQVRDAWSNLGTAWEMDRLYFKPHAICRWAQPAVEGVLAVQSKHRIDPKDVSRIRVQTFHQAARLACRNPADTETAQYSLPFPLAAALVFGRLGYRELSQDSLAHPLVREVASLVEVSEDPEMNACFPKRRYARVQIELRDGTHCDSGCLQAKWDADTPPSDQALGSKFRDVAGEVLHRERVQTLEEILWHADEKRDAAGILSLLVGPP